MVYTRKKASGKGLEKRAGGRNFAYREGGSQSQVNPPQAWKKTRRKGGKIITNPLRDKKKEKQASLLQPKRGEKGDRSIDFGGKEDGQGGNQQGAM